MTDKGASFHSVNIGFVVSSDIVNIWSVVPFVKGNLNNVMEKHNEKQKNKRNQKRSSNTSENYDDDNSNTDEYNINIDDI